MTTPTEGPPHRVSVRAPGKVNLQLSIGQVRVDGYHHLVSVFQAVALFDDVTVTRSDALRVRVTGEGVADVPTDRGNLAARAAAVVAEHVGVEPLVDIEIRKRIPVAGGMAGGSADAAAVIVGCDRLWRARLGERDRFGLAARLGSDVPFSLLGGTAVGRKRGEELTALPSWSRQHWVFAFSGLRLPTPDVYRELDRLRAADVAEPVLSPELILGLKSGDATVIGRELVNEAEPAALSLAPELAVVLKVGREAGALGAIVSGTGPTCAFLVRDESQGRELAATLQATTACRAAYYTYGPVSGPKVIEDRYHST